MASKVASIRSVKRRSVLARGLRPTESLGIVPMHVVFASLPLAAAFLAVPQFLPQLARVRRAGTMAGGSWSGGAVLSPDGRLPAAGHAVGVDGVPVQGHGRCLSGHLAADLR